jgi:hypothetical protein
MDMTFQEFQQLCTSAITTGMPVKSAAPIVIGDPAAVAYASYGELQRPLVVFKEKPDNAALRSIVGSVRFSYDAATSQTVITPITTTG